MSEAAGGLPELVAPFLASMAIAFVLAIGLGLVLSRTLVAPLTRMTETLDRLQAGDLSARLPVEGDDEVARLADSHNRLADALAARNRSLARVSHAVATLSPREGVARLAATAEQAAAEAFGFTAVERPAVRPGWPGCRRTRCAGRAAGARARRGLRGLDAAGHRRRRVGRLVATQVPTREWGAADADLLHDLRGPAGRRHPDGRAVRRGREPGRAEGRVPARRQPQPADAADVDPRLRRPARRAGPRPSPGHHRRAGRPAVAPGRPAADGLQAGGRHPPTGDRRLPVGAVRASASGRAWVAADHAVHVARRRGRAGWRPPTATGSSRSSGRSSTTPSSTVARARSRSHRPREGRIGHGGRAPTSVVRRLVATVRDHGPGIAADQRERVFERFARLQAGGGDGTGLGLSVARGLAVGTGGGLGVVDPRTASPARPLHSPCRRSASKRPDTDPAPRRCRPSPSEHNGRPRPVPPYGLSLDAPGTIVGPGVRPRARWPAKDRGASDRTISGATCASCYIATAATSIEPRRARPWPSSRSSPSSCSFSSARRSISVASSTPNITIENAARAGALQASRTPNSFRHRRLRLRDQQDRLRDDQRVAQLARDHHGQRHRLAVREHGRHASWPVSADPQPDRRSRVTVSTTFDLLTPILAVFFGGQAIDLEATVASDQESLPPRGICDRHADPDADRRHARPDGYGHRDSHGDRNSRAARRRRPPRPRRVRPQSRPRRRSARSTRPSLRT